jgi:hypothetical protein
MKLEQQACSLELAKRLRKLGVKQESLFWWVRWLDFGGAGKSYPQGDVLAYKNDPLLAPKHHSDGELYRAFTVAELGEMLPHGYYSRHGVRGYTCGAMLAASETKGTFQRDTEADVRATMLIYLLENKLLSLQLVT